MVAFTPATILFAVQGLIKLGTAAAAAYEQAVRDKELKVPLIKKIEPTDQDRATAFFRTAEGSLLVVGTRAPLAECWQHRPSPGNPHDGDPKTTADADKNVEFRMRLIAGWQSATGRALGDQSSADVLFVIAQWPKDGAPPSPAFRIALALADVAISFAQAAPELLGNDAGGEKLLRVIAAVAGELREVLPDLADPAAWTGPNWSKANFGRTLLATTLRAGFGALLEHPDAFYDQKRLQDLLVALVKPIGGSFNKAFDESGPAALKVLADHERLRDEWLPAMAAGAVRVVAQHREGFLGGLLTPQPGDEKGELIAALTGAVLDQAKDLGDDALLMRETWIGFWRAGVRAIAARPELIITGDGTTAKAKALRGLVTHVANALAEAKGLDKALLASLATAALDAAADAVPLVWDGKGWDAVARDLIDAVLKGIRPAIAAPDRALLRGLASEEQVAALVGIVLRHVAATPALITRGDAGPEAEAVIAAVAKALADKGAALLSGEGWLAVAAAAAEAASRNPGRLFRLDDKGAPAGLGAAVIALVLRVAAAHATATTGRADLVLVGAVLQDTLTVSIGLVSTTLRSDAALARFETLLVALAEKAKGVDGEIPPGRVPVLLRQAWAVLLTDAAMQADAAIAAALAK